MQPTTTAHTRSALHSPTTINRYRVVRFERPRPESAFSLAPTPVEERSLTLELPNARRESKGDYPLSADYFPQFLDDDGDPLPPPNFGAPSRDDDDEPLPPPSGERPRKQLPRDD